MCETDVHGKGRPPRLPRKKSVGPVDGAAAIEGSDIQALLDRCDSIQGQWDLPVDGDSEIRRKRSGRSQSGKSNCDLGPRSISVAATDTGHPNGVGVDDDLVVVDLVTEEAKEMEEALLEMRAAVADAKCVVKREEDEDKTDAQFAPGRVTGANTLCPVPDQCAIDPQRQKFQAKLRELALGSDDDAMHQLSQRALLEAARERLLQDDVSGNKLAVSIAPDGPGSSAGKSGNTLRRNSGKAQLPRTPGLDGVSGSRPSTSLQASRPQSGASSISVAPAGKCEVREKEPVQKNQAQRQAPISKGEELQRKSARNVAAVRKVERAAQVMDEEEQEEQRVRRIIQSDLIAAQQVMSERRVQSERERRALVLNDVLSSVKDAQHKRHEKASKLQQRCEIQDWKDRRTQRSKSEKVLQDAAAVHTQTQESSTGLGKLPRLHNSRSAPQLAPPAPVKQTPGEVKSLSLPQIPTTRSFSRIAGSSVY